MTSYADRIVATTPRNSWSSPALLELQHRLNDGWRKIEEAQARREDVGAWEDFWIDLLHQYEAEWDRLEGAR